MAPTPFRFALPPSTGLDGLNAPAETLRVFLERTLGRPTDVTVSQTYGVMSRNLLSGAVDAAWAPPFVCAKTEPEGVRVILQSIRHGQTAYASAFVTRRGGPTTMAQLRDKKVAWVDPFSVAGHLLPVAWLRARAMHAEAWFSEQVFKGSYAASLQALLDGEVDVACVHCLPDERAAWKEAVDVHLPGAAEHLALVDVTESVPSDGVVVREEGPEAERLKAALLGLAKQKGGAALLDQIFHNEGFAPAEKLTYKALYFIAPR